MEVIYLMIPMSIALGVGFIVFFAWAVRQGQWDDVDTPQHRILVEDETVNSSKETL